jgi:hypothetical protein
MIFGKRSKNTIDYADVRIGGSKLDILNSTKFLGVILDANLTWKDHISHTAKKISKSIGIISIARRNLNQKTLIQLYFAFIFPYLSYCVLIWGNSPAQTLWPVLRLQKIAFRLIANIKKHGSSRPFCKKNYLLRLPDIFSLTSGLFMFKYTNSLLPPTFNNLFNKNCTFHRYPTRTSNLLRIPLVKTKIADTFITKSGAKLWNEIPEAIKNTPKIGIFKRTFKAHLLTKYEIVTTA